MILRLAVHQTAFVLLLVVSRVASGRGASRAFCEEQRGQQRATLERLRSAFSVAARETDSTRRASLDAFARSALSPDRYCSEASGVGWLVEFDAGEAVIAAGGIRVPWRLVAVTKHGRRALPKIPSPFVATHLNKHPPLREGTATLFPGDAFVPRIVAGDFDHDSRGEAVVFSERVMSLEYAEDSDGSLWPNPFSVGQVYRASGDRIEVHPGFAAIQVAEVRGGARDAVLFSFGGLFRMVSPGPLGASEGDYPAFGPLFRVFVRKDHRATEDDPRQVEHLAAQCAQVRKTQCASMNLDVAVRFRVVCAEPAVVRLVSGTTCDRVESLAERALSGAWRADIGEALRWWTARESSK